MKLFGNKNKEENKKKLSFSKLLLIQESILIWIITIAFIVLAFFCVFQGYYSEFAWLSAMVAFPWGAYGVSQAFYYRKSMAENTSGGITHELAMAEMLETKIRAEAAAAGIPEEEIMG